MKSFFLAGVSTIFLAQGAAMAQETSGGGAEEDSGVIIVTAQRIEQDLQDVPVSITAISGDALEVRQIDSFEQLQFVAPGVNFNNGVNARQSSSSIRGIGTSLFNSGIEGSVGIVVDGVVIGREGAGIFDLSDIERVEVLRGPQGTLFGKNASAGVISFVTKGPTDSFEANLSGSYGSFDEINLSGAVSGPLADGIRGRISGYYNTRDGFVTNVNPDAEGSLDLNDRKEYGVRAKLAFDLSPTTELLLSADYSRRDQNSGASTFREVDPASPFGGLSAAFGITPSPTNRQIASDGAFFAEAEIYGFAAELSAEFGDHDFVSLTSYRHWTSSDNNDADLTPAPFLSPNSGDLSQRQFSQEFRLSSSRNQAFTYTVGAFAFLQEIDDRNDQAGIFPTPFGPFPLGSTLLANTEELNLAIFGQGEYAITDSVRLIGGVRLLYSDISSINDISVFAGEVGPAGGTLIPGVFGPPAVGPFPGAIAPFPGQTATPIPLRGSVDDVAIVWRGGIQADLSDDINVFATVSSGYKSGGIATSLGAVESAPGAGDLDVVVAEEPLQFEAGIRSKWADGAVTFNLTGYYTIIDNFQAQSLIVDPGEVLARFTVANAGEVETYGFEAELTVLPFEGLTLSGALAYTNAEFSDFPEAQCFVGQAVGPNDCVDSDLDGVGDFQDLTGGQLANSPDFIANGLIRYEFPDLGGFAPFLQAGLQYRSSTLSDNAGDPRSRLDSYALLDAQVGVSFWDDRATLTAFGRNITGTDFVESIFDLAALNGGATALSQFVSFESQETYGVRLSLNF